MVQGEPQGSLGFWVSSMTVYRLIEAGDLAAIRIGKTWRVQEGELERFLRDAERAAG